MGGFSSRPRAAPPQVAVTPPRVSRVEAAIQRALEDESATELNITAYDPRPRLTVNDTRRIIACLENPRFDTLRINNYSLHDDAVLNVFRDGLPLCTSVTTVKLLNTELTNEELDRLLPSFYNTSVTKLNLENNNRIEGQRGGEVLRDLLIGNDTLRELYFSNNRHFGPEGAIGLGRGLFASNNHLQKLNLNGCFIGNEGLTNLLLPMGDANNNSLLELNLGFNDIEGEDGGRQLTLLLQRCFPALKVLGLHFNQRLGPLGARALAPGLAARHLESLDLSSCGLGNDGVANLIPDGQVNRSLTKLDIDDNNIDGLEGGRQVSLLLSRFPALKVLSLGDNNRFGPLGAQALAPGLAAARHLEELELNSCGLGNDGVANLVPDGQVNRSLTNLDLCGYNDIEGLEGGENIIALVARCTNLDELSVGYHILSNDQQHRLDLLLERNRLCTEASALGGSTFSVLFRFVEKAHRHEHGLSAIFVILQNDGDDYFCTTNNRAINSSSPLELLVTTRTRSTRTRAYDDDDGRDDGTHPNFIDHFGLAIGSLADWILALIVVMASLHFVTRGE